MNLHADRREVPLPAYAAVASIRNEADECFAGWKNILSALPGSCGNPGLTREGSSIDCATYSFTLCASCLTGPRASESYVYTAPVAVTTPAVEPPSTPLQSLPVAPTQSLSFP